MRTAGDAEDLSVYNGQRLGASTVALGLAQGAFDAAVACARARCQFGRPIADFQGLQRERLARDARMFTIGGGTTQMMRNLIAWRLLDRGQTRRADAG